MQKCKSLSLCAVFGGLAVRWWGGIACFAYFVPALRAWVGGRVEVARVSVRRGLQGVGSALLVVCLRKFCKIYAKIANFCATICADRFRSCYLKLCQIVPKSSRAV